MPEFSHQPRKVASTFYKHNTPTHVRIQTCKSRNFINFLTIIFHRTSLYFSTKIQTILIFYISSPLQQAIGLFFVVSTCLK